MSDEKLPSSLKFHTSLDSISVLSGTVSGAVPVIEQLTGCVLRLVETSTDVNLVVHAANNVSTLVRGAIELVENALIQKVIVSEQSRGRFLYDMASCYSEMKSDGTLQQRSPFNSFEKVWMNVIDIPAQTMGEELKYSISPFIDSKINDDIHAAKCILNICRDNFGTQLLRCEPYILIVGKQAKNVSIATASIKNAIKRHAQSSVEFIPNSSRNNGPLHCLPYANSSFKSRKLTLPSWLVSDEAFCQRIHSKCVAHVLDRH